MANPKRKIGHHYLRAIRKLRRSHAKSCKHTIELCNGDSSACRKTLVQGAPVITENISHFAYGPVPSRRLGKSLGINNIPAKACTYNCVYCQAGRTTSMPQESKIFYDPEDIQRDVRRHLAKTQTISECVDFLAFVPEGEPTLDLNLGREIDLLRPLDIPIAVITNSSLLWREDVRNELARAHWVSLKIDAVSESIWRKINRPHHSSRLTPILEGILAFADAFEGRLVTETMLIEGINDKTECVREIAEFLSKLQPSKAYLSVPTRPPAEKWVHKPSAQALNRAFQVFAEKIKRVEYLIGYEGDAFAFTGDVEKDLLSITAVHPMRHTAVQSFLSRAGASWAVVERLLAGGQLVISEYDGHTFYLRGMPR
jgi:wyosine [tRNA(Phe)-imidazoG37] synthetase (radical SAM superfamily)